MIIIGGDRHKVTFNDAYFFKLNKGVETLPYYDWFPPFYSINMYVLWVLDGDGKNMHIKVLMRLLTPQP